MPSKNKILVKEMTTQRIIRRSKSELKADLIVYLERTLGIRFNGMQERLNKPPLYLFTCLQTHNTFGVQILLEVEGAALKMREKFKGGAQ